MYDYRQREQQACHNVTDPGHRYIVNMCRANLTSLTPDVPVLEGETVSRPSVLEPPAPRSSKLGLDRLAKEKRAAAEAAQANDDYSRKRTKLNSKEDPVFKGLYLQRRIFLLANASRKFLPQSHRIYDKEAKKLRLTLVDCLKSSVEGWKNTVENVKSRVVRVLSWSLLVLYIYHVLQRDLQQRLNLGRMHLKDSVIINNG